MTTNIDQLGSSGNWRIGRIESIDYMMKTSKAHPGKRTIEIEKVRFLNPESAIVDAIYVIQNPDGPARKLLSTFIVVYKEGIWKITAIRNMRPS